MIQPEADIARAAGTTAGHESVTVVVTTYNHARFLADALRSVSLQTRPADEVIVVDDGSSDDPREVVRSFPGTRLIRQENAGLAAARNRGLHAARTRYVLFLDADDMLEPIAIAAGLACFARVPNAAFVYGAHRLVSVDGAPLGGRCFAPVGPEPYRDLLQGNYVAMHATVLYRRDVLLSSGQFDASLQRCEDYDVYLRLARDELVACHGEVVARYRKHDENMSNDLPEMLRTVLSVHARHEHTVRRDPALHAAWRVGRRSWRDYYRAAMLRSVRRRLAHDQTASALRELYSALVALPTSTMRALAHAGYRRLSRRRKEGRRIGRVNLGQLGSTRPVSDDFGFDRGRPIDRYYIESFLARHAVDIAGRVLEVGDDAYTRRFGSAVVQRDVLHVHCGNPRATIVGDLSTEGTLPRGVFDCVVLTQTLHLVYDMAAALRELHAALRPGGVLLVTVPGITRIDRGEWGASWYWSLTEHALRRLLSDSFPAARIALETHGNVYAATTFLQGLAVEEVSAAKLDVCDEAFPVLVAARAQKAVDA